MASTNALIHAGVLMTAQPRRGFKITSPLTSQSLSCESSTKQMMNICIAEEGTLAAAFLTVDTISIQN